MFVQKNEIDFFHFESMEYVPNGRNTNTEVLSKEEKSRHCFQRIKRKKFKENAKFQKR